MSDKKTTSKELLAELQEIVAWFDGSDIDIDEGIKRFERGTEIATQLKKLLKDQENKIEKIAADFNL